MPQNIDLATFLGDNPYYANASKQVAASLASTQPRILTPAESAAFYAENLADSGRVMMPDGTYMEFNPAGREYQYYETGQPVNPRGGFASVPMKSIDLSTFLGNNPYYQNQTEAVVQDAQAVPADMTGITSQLPPEYQYQIDLINQYRP
jgi:hypothetical protein